jgi:hypothetical protein
VCVQARNIIIKAAGDNPELLFYCAFKREETERKREKRIQRVFSHTLFQKYKSKRDKERKRREKRTQSACKTKMSTARKCKVGE